MFVQILKEKASENIPDLYYSSVSGHCWKLNPSGLRTKCSNRHLECRKTFSPVKLQIKTHWEDVVSAAYAAIQTRTGEFEACKSFNWRFNEGAAPKSTVDGNENMKEKPQRPAVLHKCSHVAQTWPVYQSTMKLQGVMRSTNHINVPFSSLSGFSRYSQQVFDLWNSQGFSQPPCVKQALITRKPQQSSL